MDRRDFLKSTAGAAALAGSVAGAGTAAVAAPSVVTHRTLPFIMPWRAAVAGHADDGLRLARRIESASDGALRFDIIHGDLIHGDRPPRGAGLAYVPAQLRVATHPAFAFFAGLPGRSALHALELDGWLTTGGGQDLWDELASAHGFKPLLAGHGGSDPVLWSRSRIEAPEDVAGRRILARGLAAEVVRALGGSPVGADARVEETSVEADDLDVVEWGSLVHAAAGGVPARYPFGLRGAFGSAGAAMSLEIEIGLWESLPASQRAIVAAMAAAEFRESVANAAATRRMTEAALMARFGAAIDDPSFEFRSAVDRIAAVVVAHAAAVDAMARRVNASYAVYRDATTRQAGSGTGPVA
jgi:TRAP-type mannitol/chloroaromatic compound transport system substrate-binding protein